MYFLTLKVTLPRHGITCFVAWKPIHPYENASKVAVHALPRDTVLFKKISTVKLTLLEEQGFFRTKRAKQSQRKSVSDLRAASQPNITKAILQETTHPRTYTHSLTNNRHACHGANAHLISHRWKLSFPSAEASGNVFTPANRAWSPFLSLPLPMCELMEFVCAHVLACVSMSLSQQSTGNQ